mgnify:CR=1 FL=1
MIPALGTQHSCFNIQKTGFRLKMNININSSIYEIKNLLKTEHLQYVDVDKIEFISLGCKLINEEIINPNITLIAVIF